MLDRQEIVKAAAELFRKKGYAATTMQDIADQLKVTKAAIYYYVKSKEEILCECFMQAIAAHEQEIERFLAEDTPTHEKLRRIIAALAQQVIDRRPITIVTVYEKAHLPRQMRQEIDARMRRYMERVVSLIEQAIEQGVMRSNNPRVTALAIIGMCNAVDSWYEPKGSMKAPDVGLHLADLALLGLLTDTGRALRSRVQAAGDGPVALESRR